MSCEIVGSDYDYLSRYKLYLCTIIILVLAVDATTAAAAIRVKLRNAFERFTLV